MWFSKADGGRDDVVDVGPPPPPTPPLDDDLENGLRLEKSGMPDEAVDRRLPESLLSVNWIKYGSEDVLILYLETVDIFDHK